MNDSSNTWNLPWQALQRRLAVEPRATSTADSWRGRVRVTLPRIVLRDSGASPAERAK